MQRSAMGNSKVCVLATGVSDDRLEKFAFIKRADDCGDHVHELEVLSFHVAGKQTLRIRGKLEKPPIE